MSETHLEDEDPGELYGEYIDENYQWRPEAGAEDSDQDSGPEFLSEGKTDVDLLTGGGER